MFDKGYNHAILHATYKDGKPGGELTPVHNKVEYHRFKSNYLFKKDSPIPQNLYAMRLIQYFFFIDAIEKKLKALSAEDKSSIEGFFTLTYLEALWRTPAIRADLKQLGVDPDAISENKKTKRTKSYLEEIEHFPPKIVLAHFLMHVSGFLHGGTIINSKYITKSNQLTRYKIPNKQYNFDKAMDDSLTTSPMALYRNMMEHLDKQKLTETEYENVHKTCLSVFTIMTQIYEELCELHIQQPKQFNSRLVMIMISLCLAALFLKLASDYYTPEISQTPSYSLK